MNGINTIKGAIPYAPPRSVIPNVAAATAIENFKEKRNKKFRLCHICGMGDEKWAGLIEKAIEASKLAYCPYSKYAVGAALQTSEGVIFTGCNVENASYGLTICAERTALCKAISEGCLSAGGGQQFEAIAVFAPNGSGDAAPCGACRQFLVEFNPNMLVIIVSSGDRRSTRSWRASELIPNFFGPANLQ